MLDQQVCTVEAPHPQVPTLPLGDLKGSAAHILVPDTTAELQGSRLSTAAGPRPVVAANGGPSTGPLDGGNLVCLEDIWL